MNRITRKVSPWRWPGPKEATRRIGRGAALLTCLAMFVMLTGCASQVYRPMSSNVPPMSVEEACGRLKALTGVEIFAVESGMLANSMLRGTIVGVEINNAGADFAFEVRRPFGTSMHKCTIPYGSIAGVSTPGGGYWYLDFTDGKRLFPPTKEQAVSIAQAFYVLGHRAHTARPPEGTDGGASVSVAAAGPPGPGVPTATAEWPSSGVVIMEVKPVTRAEGVEVSDAFLEYFTDGLRAQMARTGLAGQVVEAGTAPAGAESAILECTIIEYRTVWGAPIYKSETRFYRKSDGALFKTVTTEVGAKPSPLNTDKNVGENTGKRTADEIKRAMK